MNLMTGILGLGHHLGGWRHRDSWSNTVMNIDHAAWIAKEAERGKLDLLFIADGNAVRQMDKPALFAANSPSDRPAVFEPTTMLSAVAMVTRHIGLLATATTTYEEPYLLARKFASLDHISHGRACWNIVTTSYPGDSVNFGKPEHASRADRYERAEEFVEVCQGLWDSWAADAFIEDKSSGNYLNPTRVRVLNHVGKHFSVQGPLNAARCPQGYPVKFMAGQSELGREFAAKMADCLFTVTDTKESAQAVYANVKARLAKYGRSPETLRIMPGCSVYVGRTAAEADELYEELQALISPELGVPYLSKLVEHNLGGLPLDGPMPDLSTEVNAISSFRQSISALAQRENLTVRQTYQRVLPSMGHIVFKGSAAQVAEEMADWYTSKACDGFNVLVPVLPRGLTDFVDLVVPELQKRDVFRTEYQGKTLREVMGLPTPRNPYFDH